MTNILLDVEYVDRLKATQRDWNMESKGLNSKIAELEQELALMKAVRPSQQEIDDKDLLIKSMTEGAEELLNQNERLREALQHLSEYLDYLGYHEKVKYIKQALEGGSDE